LIYLFVEKLTDARKIVGQKFNLCEEFCLMRLLQSGRGGGQGLV
jgi:hypothetical protein